jgi:hypothetical protein
VARQPHELSHDLLLPWFQLLLFDFRLFDRAFPRCDALTTSDPAVLAGQLTMRGTAVTVRRVILEFHGEQ